MHLGLCKVHQTGPNASCLLLCTNSLLHTHRGCSAPSAPPTWTLLPLSLPGRQKVLIFGVHLKKCMWFYVPGRCECTQLINCIRDLICSYCSFYIQMASSEDFACWPFFCSQLQCRRDLTLLVSYRERRETEVQIFIWTYGEERERSSIEVNRAMMIYTPSKSAP